MTMRSAFIGASLAALLSSPTFAQEVTFPSVPAPLPVDRSGGILVPTPNGGFIGGASNSNGQGGLITHQPLGGGYSSSGGTYGNGNGTTIGGTIINGPAGPIGGGVTFGTTF